jgi:radical SAM superfamily enzyme YgiQ (UPF0313 family)
MTGAAPRVLLIGPYDPHCGEYTFLAPPLGVWRLAGMLRSAGAEAEVFDPNCCREPPQRSLEKKLRQRWDVIGVSTTGMTLQFDLELAYIARRAAPSALIVAGGMEATFRPELMFTLGPFDLIVLGEGERPLLELVARLRAGKSLAGMSGTVQRGADGKVVSVPQRALDREELRDAIYSIPYADMPYEAYWERLEAAYRVGSLPSKAAREAHLAEIRSVRLITLNYCPMNCTFCSSTNFLHEAQQSVAGVARLDAHECMTLIQRIVAAHPRVRTIIFQDDIFVFTRDKRVLELCDAIVAAKARGTIPSQLQFISTNRIDAMTEERLAAMRRAGFRVLGFGIESFSPRVLAEFNKAQIHRHIEPMLSAAIAAGITPFLDIILTSPRAQLADLVETLRSCYRWMREGCEIGMYPYIIPFSGAAFARDPSLIPHTHYVRREVAGTGVSWEQPAKILPIDPGLRDLILRIERDFERMLASLQSQAAHLPSRVRSLIWILCSIPILAKSGHFIADEDEVRAELRLRVPLAHREAASVSVAVPVAVPAAVAIPISVSAPVAVAAP